MTQPGSSCPAGTDCVTYTVAVPALSPYSAVFAASGVTLTGGVSPAAYKVDALAFIPQSGGTADCSPSELESGSVTSVGGTTLLVPTLAFSGCQ